MRVELPIVGGAYKHRITPVSAQTLKNWYVEANPTKDTLTLQMTPGAKSWSTGSGDDRGMAVFRGELYKVTDTTLYRIGRDGSQTSIGAIVGQARAYFATDQNVLVIVSAGRVYSFDGTTLTEVSDPDQESPDYVTYLNNQCLYDGTGNRFAVSDAGDLTAVDGLNYASAESDGDELIRPYAFNQLVYLMGEKTIETWWNSGVGDPPFDRVQGGIIQVGLGAGGSLANNDSFMYFLGDDLIVYQLISSQVAEVSTIAMADAFSGYSTTDDALGFCFTFQKQKFYFLAFPTEGVTWLYNETSNQWSQMTSGVDEGAHVATSYASCYGKHLIADGGNVHEWDLDTFTDNSEVIVRERSTGNLSADLLGGRYAGLPVTWNWIELILDSKATVTGQGSDPELMLEFSDDGGYTWSSERKLKLGRVGDYIWSVKAEQLGQSVQRVYRFRVSDSIGCTLQRASADVEIGLG